MTSNIDPSKPTSTHAFTADMRANFLIAKTEIEALQAEMATSAWAAIATPSISAGSLVLDLATGGVFRVALDADITALALASAVAGRVTTCQLELLGDGTLRAIDFGAWTVVTGSPVPTSATGRKDVYDIRTDGSNVLVWLTAQNVPA
jgi:hypothetical protein